jgi:hypothetical protein
MPDANNTGDGSTNPFGNGAGVSQGGTVPGNDFVSNPGGSGTSRKGRTFHDQQPAPQRKYEQTADLNNDQTAPGGRVPMVQSPPGPDVGVGSIGNGAKPFRLGGE